MKSEWAQKRRELGREDFIEWGKEQRRIKQRNLWRELQNFLHDYKSNKGCCRCGERNPRTLTFHHRDPKKKSFNIHCKNRSMVKVLAEIKKCDVLCFNCHTKYFTEYLVDNISGDISIIKEQIKIETDKKIKIKLHKKRQALDAKLYAYEYKLSHPCIQCGEVDEKCLSFHHRCPSDKDGKISRLYRTGIKKVREEIEKCDVLCHNCHMKLHNGYRGKDTLTFEKNI